MREQSVLGVPEHSQADYPPLPGHPNAFFRPYPSLGTAQSNEVTPGDAPCGGEHDDARTLLRDRHRAHPDPPPTSAAATARAGTTSAAARRRVRRASSPWVVGLAIGPVACGSVDTDPIWTDGAFGDWTHALPQPEDPIGDALEGSAVDLGAVLVQDDPNYLHLLLDVGRVVTIQGMRGLVEVILNADGDLGTGARWGDVEGADLVAVLSRPVDTNAWSAGHIADTIAQELHGAGVAIRRIGTGGAGDLESADQVGLLLAPTHSSDRFEVRLSRIGAAPAAHGDADTTGTRAGALPPAAAGAVITGQVRHLRHNTVLDETPVFRHVLAASPGNPPPLLDIQAVRKDAGTFRVVAWNVSDGNFRQERAAFQRILRALGPDAALLDELPADITQAELEAFSRGMDTGAGAEGGSPLWSWWLAAGGGRQRTAVGAVGIPLSGEPTMARLEYPEGALERWANNVSDQGEIPWMAPPSRMAQSEAQGGLSATGAWITVLGRDILLVPVDLQSAGYDGSPRDRLREIQATVLNRAIARAFDGRGDAGLIVGGDLNLVGSSRPMQALRHGLGIDGRPITVVRIPRLRDRSLATWRSIRTGDPFSPGRLDFVLYRARWMDVHKAFVFDAADLTADARKDLGLRDGDSRNSDHLPVTVDFLIR